MQNRDPLQLILPLVGVALGGLLTFIVQWGLQRGQRRAARAEALRSAYAEWAALLDAQFDIAIRLAYSLNVSGAWEKLHDLHAKLQVAMYRLLLLETDPGSRVAIQEIPEKLPPWRDEVEWQMFRAGIDPNAPFEDQPRPYARELSALLAGATERLSR